MTLHNLFKMGILGIPALCGAWGFAAQPVEIINNSHHTCWITADPPLEGLAAAIVAEGASTSATELKDLALDHGEKLVLTAPDGAGPTELETSLGFDLGSGKVESWSAKFRFGESSSILNVTPGTAQPRMECKGADNILTLQVEATAGAGGSQAAGSAAKPLASVAAATSAAVESKAGARSAGSTAAPAKAKISMYSHTFPDVVPLNPRARPEKVTVSLSYPYRAVDPQKTRLFFQGEALVIDPESAGFDFYVTFPLRPCIFGRIHDPETGRSLVFHKYAVHNMESLRPRFAKLAASNPDKLEVTLFTCEMIEALRNEHAPYFGGKSQVQELNDVRNFLVNEFKIPEGQVERRFLTAASFRKSPLLGQYDQTPITIGVTKSGEVFTTSVFSGDFFGLGDMVFHPKIRKELGGAKTFRDLPAHFKFCMSKDVSDSILVSVKKRYDNNASTNAYWSRDFYSADDRLNVPAASLGTRFKIQILEDGSVYCTSNIPLLSPGAGSAETKTESAKGEAKGKKNGGKATLPAGKTS